MAKYSQPKFAQAVLKNLPKHIALSRLKYVITAKTSEAKSTYVSKLTPFNKFMKTHKIEVNYDTAVVQVDIFLDDKWYQGAILPHLAQSESGKFTEIKFKYHHSKSSPIEENKIQKVYIKEGMEVGWLLIREDETVDALLKRIYAYHPTVKEFSIFKNNNAHLPELSTNGPMTVLKPCQVVILSNKYGNDPKLSEYKQLASSVESKLKLLRKIDKFDAKFLAHNYELLYDYWNMAQEMVLANEVPKDKVAEFKKVYCDADREDTTLEKVEDKAGAIVGYREEKDRDLRTLKANEVKELKEEAIKKANNIAKKIDQAYVYEESIRSPLARAVNRQKFRKKYIKLFNELDAVAKKDFQAVKQVNYSPALKRFLKTDILLRDEAFKDGLKAFDQKILDLGKISAGLKDAKRLVIGLGVAVGVVQVLEAYATGEKELAKKVAYVETAKFAGGMAGGALGGFIAGIVVGTSGGGAIVIIAIAAYYGGKQTSDLIEEKASRYLEICK